MARLLVCTSHDLVLFSGISVVKDAPADDAPSSTRRIILPPVAKTTEARGDAEAHAAHPAHAGEDAPKDAEHAADAADAVSDTAPTLVPPRPSGTYAIPAFGIRER